MTPPSADNSRTEDEGKKADRLGVAAIVCGCVGLLVAGILLAIVTGVLASVAGAKAREANRPLDNAYIALGLAVLDGVVWLALQFLFELPALAG
jgi:hypothetical protein